MKNIVSTFCLCIALLIGGCASTGNPPEKVEVADEPEGIVYVQRTINQVIDEINEPANIGKTLYYESEEKVNMSYGGDAGKRNVWFPRSGYITMDYEISSEDDFRGVVIFYRVIVSGDEYVPHKFVIDSFKE